MTSKYHFLVLCNPENRRYTMFENAVNTILKDNGICEGISYMEALNPSFSFVSIISRIDQSEIIVFRYESSGENQDVTKAILEYGGNQDYDWNHNHHTSNETKINNFINDFGSIILNIYILLGYGYDVQYTVGYNYLLKKWQSQLDSTNRKIFYMNNVNDIITMTNKLETHQLLSNNGFNNTEVILSSNCDFNQLINLMDNNKIKKVIIKPKYGSSACGIIFYHRQV